jgi:hypothetical protein
MIAKIEAYPNWEKDSKIAEGHRRLVAMSDEQYNREAAAAIRHNPNHKMSKVLKGK